VGRRQARCALFAPALSLLGPAAFGAPGLALGLPTSTEPDRDATVTVTGAGAGRQVVLLSAMEAGTAEHESCATGLAEPLVLGEAIADASGAAAITWRADIDLANRSSLLQAVALDGCSTSAAIEVSWRVESWVGTWDPEVADAKLRGAESQDVFGSRVVLGGDTNADGVEDLLVAAPHTDLPKFNVGTIYLFDQIDDGVTLAAGRRLELIGSVYDGWAGMGLAFAGDVDGNGRDDILVGAPFGSDFGKESGAAYLVLTPRLGAVSLDQADLSLYGEELSWFGGQVAPAEDFDGDLLPDLWVSASAEDEDRGAVYLVPGTTRGQYLAIGDVSAAVIVGDAPGDAIGASIEHLADVSGDGRADLAIGAEGVDGEEEDEGATAIFFQTALGRSTFADADVVLVSREPGANSGARVSAVGDLDGDGIDDLAIHARSADNGDLSDVGSLALLTSPPSDGAPEDLAALLLLGQDDEGEGGAHVAACDLDGDGELDLAVAAHESGDPGPETGRVHLFYGPLPSGVVELGESAGTIAGTEPVQNMGQGVACADLDADGRADLVASAEGDENGPAGLFSGSVYVFRGRERFEDPDPDEPPPDPTDPPDAEEPGEKGEPAPGGCHCASAGWPLGGWAAALLGLVAALRRRSRGGYGSGA
jgi:hypothetical protein